MSNEFRGTGNVGDVPALKSVVVEGENRRVTALRVFFDDYRQDSNGGVEQSGGFWLDVNVWGERRAEDVALHVKKGARIHVIGHLTENRWTAKDSGEERRAFQLNADQLTLALSRIESVTFRPRREPQEGGA